MVLKCTGMLQMMRMDSWVALMEAAHLLDLDFMLTQAQLCYLWGRMGTIDEIKDYARYESITFVDFMECLARVADMKCLPSRSELADAG